MYIPSVAKHSAYWCLISIHLHLQKISGRQHLRAASLASNHALHSLLENQHSKNTKSHRLSLDNLTFKQCLKIKSAVVNSNNRLNGIFPSFDTSHKELSSGFHLVDNFPNHFSFHTVNRQDKEIKSAHIRQLDKIFEDSCLDSKTVLVISDASIKNDVVTSILHVYFGGNTISKTIHHTIKHWSRVICNQMWYQPSRPSNRGNTYHCCHGHYTLCKKDFWFIDPSLSTIINCYFSDACSLLQ